MCDNTCEFREICVEGRCECPEGELCGGIMGAGGLADMDGENASTNTGQNNTPSGTDNGDAGDGPREANNSEGAGGQSMSTDTEQTPGMANDSDEPPAGRGNDCETAPLARTAVDDLGPASRINTLSSPGRFEEAAAAGCQTLGSNNGTGLAGFLGIIGILTDELVNSDIDTGEIPLVLLSQIDGWSAGDTATQAGAVTFNLYNGARSDDGLYFVDSRSLNGRTLQSGARSSFDARLNGGQLTTSRGELRLETNLPLSIINFLRLSQSSVFAQIGTHPDGISLVDARIEGYLTTESLIEMVRDTQSMCMRADAPGFCDQISALFGGPPAQIVPSIILPILGGADSLVTDGDVHRCDERECNAVSVCLLIQAEPVRISGVVEQ